MTTEVCEVIYFPNDQGEYNVFTLPVCRSITSCTVQEALEVIEYYLKNGVAKKVEYI
jgi:hypothetical protein